MTFAETVFFVIGVWLVLALLLVSLFVVLEELARRWK